MRIALRALIAPAAIAAVIVARTTVGWGSLAVMLIALLVLLALLADYNRKYK
jgi:hypothetical protein